MTNPVGTEEAAGFDYNRLRQLVCGACTTDSICPRRAVVAEAETERATLQAELSRCREEKWSTGGAMTTAEGNALRQVNAALDARCDALEEVALTTSALHWENERLRAALEGLVVAHAADLPKTHEAALELARNALSQEGTK